MAPRVLLAKAVDTVNTAPATGGRALGTRHIWIPPPRGRRRMKYYPPPSPPPPPRAPLPRPPPPSVSRLQARDSRPLWRRSPRRPPEPLGCALARVRVGVRVGLGIRVRSADTCRGVHQTTLNPTLPPAPGPALTLAPTLTLSLSLSRCAKSPRNSWNGWRLRWGGVGRRAWRRPLASRLFQGRPRSVQPRNGRSMDPA